jgi:hypothetical protein
MQFSWVIYKELNKDINLKTAFEFEEHYELHGKKEGRLYSIYQLYPNFNSDKYKQNYYSELGHLGKIQLELHWLQYGRYQNRYYDIDELIHNLNNTHIIKYEYKMGIAITIFSRENTPLERIEWSIKCLYSIVNMINNMPIIIVIDGEISKYHLENVINIITNKTNVTIYKNEVNYGIAISKNICIYLLEKIGVNLFILLDDDIFIKRDITEYICNVFMDTNIPILTNYNSGFKYTDVNIKNIKFMYCHHYFGNILVIPYNFLSIYGYFQKYPFKYGAEHLEITKRYFNNSIYNGICANFDDYVDNYSIINNINTLHLHSIKDLDYSEAIKNYDLMLEYLKDIKYIPFSITDYTVVCQS